ncbi:MalM family protein [Vibrio navarrensis]|uniref:Maltose operon protein n=1 Tax=Vibrio navarrensis TaxID=29495 RepID=A0A099LUP8_9VIBR|nr:MalM family protein [Vibrio navarrensis]EJK2113870.1 transcriptional regulator [Vibrio navarrensis]KGK11379.1 maltose operon protein [Vibrio navarrensis]QOD68084.1 transcriptional regulator [Vibrio navarrensis]
MKNKHSLLAVVLGALLTGCASDAKVQTELTPPTNAEVCCTDFAQFPYAQLNDNEDFKFDVDLASPVGTFSAGNSHFAAFRFSERSGDVTVTLSSLMIDDSVFAPEVLLLDNQFQVVETLKLQDFQILPSDAFTRTRYIEKFTTNAEQTPYFVIYTPADQLGKQVTVDHPAKIRAKEFGEVMPMVVDPVYTYRLGGRIELQVETRKLRPFRAAETVQSVQMPVVEKTIQAQPESQQFYLSAIEQAVAAGDIPKALSLLDEAKALNIPGAQETFVRAVNQMK